MSLSVCPCSDSGCRVVTMSSSSLSLVVSAAAALCCAFGLALLQNSDSVQYFLLPELWKYSLIGNDEPEDNKGEIHSQILSTDNIDEFFSG